MPVILLIFGEVCKCFFLLLFPVEIYSILVFVNYFLVNVSTFFKPVFVFGSDFETRVRYSIKIVIVEGVFRG